MINCRLFNTELAVITEGAQEGAYNRRTTPRTLRRKGRDSAQKRSRQKHPRARNSVYRARRVRGASRGVGTVAFSHARALTLYARGLPGSRHPPSVPLSALPPGFCASFRFCLSSLRRCRHLSFLRHASTTDHLTTLLHREFAPPSARPSACIFVARLALTTIPSDYITLSSLKTTSSRAARADHDDAFRRDDYPAFLDLVAEPLDSPP